MLPLKEATSEKHKIAERMPFNVRMFRGQLSKAQYLLYLHQQLEIFDAIEHVGVPDENLKRVERVKQDIAELNAQGENKATVLPQTKAYSNYLRSLTYEQILPHVYLNYLAVMFGGQMIRKAVPSSGKLYDFDNMEQAALSIRRVQQDAWADEVNKGFDFNIQIFDGLEQACLQATPA